MCVKLPAPLNIQLEYIFYTWGNAQSFWVPLFCHQEKKYSLETQCCNKDCCECLLDRPRDGNLTQNGDPRVGKLTFEHLKMSNFPWVAPPPPPHRPSWGKPLIGALVLAKSRTRSRRRLRI